MLEVRRVRKRWGAAAPVLDGVSMTLPEGRLALIEGPNGAGKTTLLRIIAGLMDPEEGTVRIRGRDAARDRTGYQRELALVSAGSSALHARLDVRGHLRLAAGLGLVSRARTRRAIDRARERFELGAFGGQRVDRLSMGERQRLRLALAFLHEPGLVLLDEPLTSLDPRGRALLAGALRDHLADGGSILWVGPSGETPVIEPDLRMSLTAGRLTFE